ncbi:hypothetical protein GCM10022393_03950 [Aquimarina addita]|uniref:Uncharacterized protein n=1 Tax=Aquimarina addita TaxID=870485 RepID=A0ABP7X9Y6_9FLAO
MYIFAFFLLPVIIGIPLALSFLVHRAVKRYDPSKALAMSFLTFLLPYLICSLFYIDANKYNKNTEFYSSGFNNNENEFRMITKLELPKSANSILTKKENPYFIVDDISSMAIHLNQEDFRVLYKNIKKSSKLINRSDAYSTPYQWIKDQTGNQQYIYYASSTIENEYHFIGFCEDQKTVITHSMQW